MVKVILIFLLLLGYSIPSFGKAVRTVEASEDTIIQVRTAIGYSTILTFNSKPTSAVLGDQDAFKLEYVGNSITVKPLISQATSNLFIFTPYERFNITLKTVTSTDVDYHLRISAPHAVPLKQKEEILLAQKVVQTKQSPSDQNTLSEWKGVSLKYISQTSFISDDRKKMTAFEVELASKQYSMRFSPGSLGVKQGDLSLVLERISLNSLSLNPQSPPIHANIYVLNERFNPKLPLSLFFQIGPRQSIEVRPPGQIKMTKKKGV
jgi:type IV secretory pathway VirB9-like protein